MHVFFVLELLKKMKCLLIAAISSHTNLTSLGRTLDRFRSWNRYCIAHERGEYESIACQLLFHEGYGWASAINASARRMEGCTSLALFLDDTQFVSLDPDEMLSDMRRRNFDMASPTVFGASWAHMTRKQPRSCVVTETNMIEYFTTFFSKRGWDCFSTMLSKNMANTVTRSLGWGYDLCQQAFCPELRFGVFHKYITRHTQNSHRWTYRGGRRLSLRSISERHTQERKIRQWVRIHLNTTCHTHSGISKNRVCVE